MPPVRRRECPQLRAAKLRHIQVVALVALVAFGCVRLRWLRCVHVPSRHPPVFPEPAGHSAPQCSRRRRLVPAWRVCVEQYGHAPATREVVDSRVRATTPASRSAHDTMADPHPAGDPPSPLGLTSISPEVTARGNLQIPVGLIAPAMPRADRVFHTTALRLRRLIKPARSPDAAQNWMPRGRLVSSISTAVPRSGLPIGACRLHSGSSSRAVSATGRPC